MSRLFWAQSRKICSCVLFFGPKPQQTISTVTREQKETEHKQTQSDEMLSLTCGFAETYLANVSSGDCVV